MIPYLFPGIPLRFSKINSEKRRITKDLFLIKEINFLNFVILIRYVERHKAISMSFSVKGGHYVRTRHLRNIAEDLFPAFILFFFMTFHKAYAFFSD